MDVARALLVWRFLRVVLLVLAPLGLMHPTQVATPFNRPGWVYEEKVDGYRMAPMNAGDGTRLITRNGIQHTKRFPELVQALDSLSAGAFILDGEVAVYDRALISRFEWLRGRPKDEPATLPVYLVFDVLELGGRTCGESRCGSGGSCWRNWWRGSE